MRAASEPSGHIRRKKFHMMNIVSLVLIDANQRINFIFSRSYPEENITSRISSEDNNFVLIIIVSIIKAMQLRIQVILPGFT